MSKFAVSGESLAHFFNNSWRSTEDPFCWCRCCWYM